MQVALWIVALPTLIALGTLAIAAITYALARIIAELLALIRRLGEGWRLPAHIIEQRRETRHWICVTIAWSVASIGSIASVITAILKAAR